MIIRLAEGGDPKIEGDGDEDAPGGGERGTEVGRRGVGTMYCTVATSSTSASAVRGGPPTAMEEGPPRVRGSDDGKASAEEVRPRLREAAS